MKQRASVLLATAALIPMVAVGASMLLRDHFRPGQVYLAVWAIYLATLAGVCATVVGPTEVARAFGPGRSRLGWAAASMLVAAPPLFVVFLRVAPHLTLTQWALLLGLSAVNGTLEEVYWRGAFAVRFPDLARAVVVPTVAFTSWHLALASIPGVVVDGGMPTMIGGAAVMGTVWALASWKMGSIRWSVAGHIAANVFALGALIRDNSLA
jgi:hypothetical protein